MLLYISSEVGIVHLCEYNVQVSLCTYLYTCIENTPSYCETNLASSIPWEESVLFTYWQGQCSKGLMNVISLHL